MAYIVMAHIFMAYRVLSYIVMAYKVMAQVIFIDSDWNPQNDEQAMVRNLCAHTYAHV